MNANTSGERCTGHCCQNIGLTVSPAKMRESYMAWLSSASASVGERRPLMDMGAPKRLLGEKTATIFQEIHLIYPMLRFTHESKRHPERRDDEPDSDETVYHYKCNHFDKMTRKCSIYEIRPTMCSSFAADDGGCGYMACTWAEARAKRLKRDAERAAAAAEAAEAKSERRALKRTFSDIEGGPCEKADVKENHSYSEDSL